MTTRIRAREEDTEVEVRVYNFTTTDEAYTKTDFDYRGNPIRARLLNTITEYEPRTRYLIPAVKKAYDDQALKGYVPVLLTSAYTRPYVRSVVERFRPATVVMSQNEIHYKAKIRTLESI